MIELRRVLYLSGWTVGPNGEGSANFVHEQVVELSSHVDALFVEHGFASIGQAGRHPAAVLRPQRVRESWPVSVRALRIRTVRLPTRITRRSLLDDLRKAGSALARRLRRADERIDLVHAHVVLPAGLLGVHAAAELRVPMVLQEHSGPFDMHLDTEEKSAAVRETLDHSARILAVSEALAMRLRHVTHDRGRVRVLPNLVRTDLFRPAPTLLLDGELRLINVGGLVPLKGHGLLLESLAAIHARGMAARLSIVGDGPLRPALEQRARELGVSDRVAFMGQLSRAATARAMADSHIYVCSSEVETFGLAVAEALATGRPVVTTACGGPEEIVGTDLGRIVRSSDPNSLAAAILTVAGQLDAYEPQDMHSKIERRLGRDAFSARVLAAYADALGHQPPATATDA